MGCFSVYFKTLYHVLKCFLIHFGSPIINRIFWLIYGNWLAEKAIGGWTKSHFFTRSWFIQFLFSDKMNSILIFVGCGVIIVIILVTCIILTTRCHLRIRPGHHGEGHMSSSNSSKQQLYQPYCVDTMTLVNNQPLYSLIFFPPPPPPVCNEIKYQSVYSAWSMT